MRSMAALPPPPTPPGDDARVWELCAVLTLAPVVVGLVSRMGPLPEDQVARSLARGAIYLVVPCLFGVSLLAVTRATWAAWIGFILEAALFALLAVADTFMLGRLTARTGVGTLAIAYTLVRVLALSRVRRARG